MSIEILKNIPNIKGYKVSNKGKIWSTKTNKFLASKSGKGGYKRLHLYNKNPLLVHRLVLETFVGPCPDGMECRHLDGNSNNNNLKNLCWGTKKENMQDAIKHGTHRCLYQDGELNLASKLTKQNIKMVVYMYQIGGFAQKEIAKIYNITQPTVSYIINKKIWKGIV